ncbi:MAG: UDP-N-acetylglucosamine 2-epimerase (non-hydrolyzing) [Desulfobacterium sp.]|nr:UDP-N-acetylglucosamine 2-epimerase (non-hydrolyzing) [Desulfobacterium sp.]
MKILSVVGARPNFMKIAPFIRTVEAYNKANADGIQHLLIHTGQHYDDQMSRSFFDALNIPEADINLGVGSGTHAQQVGQTMMAFETVVQAEKPDWVVVVGDVNATLACSVTAKKEWVRCCHIEAGLRSGDMTMPEEVNRLVTDRLSDLLLTPDLLSSENLRREGVTEEKIKFVGNIMIDTLEAQRSKAEKLLINQIVKENALSGQPGLSVLAGSPYGVMTLHRPSNVDQPDVFTGIFEFLLTEVAGDMPLFWPVHPRTRQKMQAFGLWQRALACPGLVMMEPLGYHELLRLNMDARIMLTDSGGLQEECTVLGTPCLTLRWNTERPVTLREHGGASVLVGNNVDRIREEYKNTLSSERRPVRPELWDGNTAERCLRAILEYQDS